MAEDDCILPAMAEEIKLKTQIPFESWIYQPQGTLILNDDAEIATYGTISYKNPFYELGVVIKMKDWHFTFERKNEVGRFMFPDNNNPLIFVVTAFYKNYHCNFGTTFLDSPEALYYFTNLILTTFAPILMPEVSQPLTDDSKKVKIEWKPNSIIPAPLTPIFPSTGRPGKVHISIPLP